jgi:DNA-binding MarR family transcriptional regulator
MTRNVITVQNAITDLVLETFRLNGRLLASGDALVADLGLTSARWQVLGATVLSPTPLSVAQIARNMGLTRQAVQRLANEMEGDGLLRFAPNPHHQRAKLVVELGAGLDARKIAGATATLRGIRQRLENRTHNENDT